MLERANPLDIDLKDSNGTLNTNSRMHPVSFDI